MNPQHFVTIKYQSKDTGKMDLPAEARSNYRKHLEELKKQADNQIKLVLHRMALKIQNPALADYDGSCFVSLNESIFTAKKQAEENYNNQFSKKDTFDSRYLDMREKQTKILYEMFKAAQALGTIPPSSTIK